MTLLGIASHLAAEYEARDRLRGQDWYQLSPEEQFVFAIKPARFPRMLAAWDLYCLFNRIGDAEDHGLSDEPFERARRARPDLFEERVVDERKFQDFAKEYAGITNREATAIFHKIGFWKVRNVGVAYGDER